MSFDRFRDLLAERKKARILFAQKSSGLYALIDKIHHIDIRLLQQFEKKAVPEKSELDRLCDAVGLKPRGSVRR
jgi:hypothetical protein